MFRKPKDSRQTWLVILAGTSIDAVPCIFGDMQDIFLADTSQPSTFGAETNWAIIHFKG